MSKLTKLLVCGLLTAVWATPLLGDAVSEKRKAQNKLLAYRAARADAIRKLAERIKGLNITSKTRVQDFVTESDTIRTSMDTFLVGLKEKDVKHLEDGVCEVVMEIKLTQVIATLKRIHSAHYKGDKIKLRDFQQMTTTNKISILRETGQGVPREELMEDELVAPATGATQATFSGASAAARAYWAKYCTARGRLMAERAARLDALRKLAERIKGLRITSKTTVQDFVTESDEIKTRLETFIKGMKEVGRRYHKDELIIEVEMQIKLREFLLTLKSWTQMHLKGDRIKLRQLEEAVVRTRDKVIRETGMGVPPEAYLKKDTVTVEIRKTVALAAASPPWATQTKDAVGKAAIDTEDTNKARAKLMAYRAAELDARRKLAEQINGLMITSRTSVLNFVTQSDKIRTSMLTFQQGAQVVENSQKLLSDGSVQVTVEIDLKPLWSSILYYQRTLKITIP